MSFVKNLVVTGAIGILASCSGGEVAPAPTTIEAPDVTEARGQLLDEALSLFDHTLECSFTENPEDFSLIPDLVNHEFSEGNNHFSFGVDIGDGYVLGVRMNWQVDARAITSEIFVVDTNGDELETTSAVVPDIPLSSLSANPAPIDLGIPLTGLPQEVIEVVTLGYIRPGGNPQVAAGCLSWNSLDEGVADEPLSS